MEGGQRRGSVPPVNEFPGGARPNLALSRGTETWPCPVAEGFNSHERCQGVTAMFMLN